MNKPSPKKIAIQIAKQGTQETLKVFETASKQIGLKPETSQQNEENSNNPKKLNEPTPQEKMAKAAQSQRLMQAYDTELEQIRKENLFKELQRKIAQGETVAIENFSELTPEQREVLKAQTQAIEMQKEASKSQQKESVPQVVSKKGRKILGMFKKKSQQYVETRQPPSS